MPALRLVLVGLISFPPVLWAAPAPSFRLGIVGVGLKDGQAQRAYPLLEKRLQRWLSDRPDLRIQPVALGTVELLDPEKSPQVKIINAAADRLFAGHADELTRWDASVSAQSAHPLLSPWRQRYAFARASALLTQGRKAAAAQAVADALRLHPEGVLAAAAWKGVAQGQLDALYALVELEKARLRPGCHFELEAKPEVASVKLDGFRFGRQRRFSLLPGKTYAVQASAPGFESAISEVDCRGAGQWLESIALKPERGIDPARLAEAQMLAGTQALIALRPGKDQSFQMSLFSAQGGIQNLPTTRSLRFASLLASPVESSMPLAPQTLNDALERHRAAPLKVSAQMSERGYEIPSLQATPEPPRAWYESRTLWFVLGVAGVGVATALLATGPKQTQSNPVLHLRVD